MEKEKIVTIFFTRYIFDQYVEEYSIHFKKKCYRMKHFVYMNTFNRFSIETII